MCRRLFSPAIARASSLFSTSYGGAATSVTRFFGGRIAANGLTFTMVISVCLLLYLFKDGNSYSVTNRLLGIWLAKEY